ncbi:MAG TPA: hypothetical protein VN397_01005 [Candidatus Methylomirabilis sp.]|nr:hypothetical protein [Candidatus Methylomirabilis sp.]
MTWSEFLKTFFRHTAYALALFVVVVLTAEFLTPGSVTPFIDPLPLGVVAFAFLSADAMRRQAPSRPWARIIAGVFVSAGILLVLSTSSVVAGSADTVAIFAVGGALLLTIVAVFKPRQEP